MQTFYENNQTIYTFLVYMSSSNHDSCILRIRVNSFNIDKHFYRKSMKIINAMNDREVQITDD